MFVMPSLIRIFNLKCMGDKYTSFMMNLVPKIFEEREKSGQKRGDFVDLLLELKTNQDLLEHEIVPQVAAFFFAGKSILNF